MEYGNLSDIELIAQLKQGKPSDNVAFNTIYLKYSAKLYGYCHYSSDSKDTADELMQDTWMRFFNAVKSGKSTNSILPYLFTIARNLSINNFHKENKKSNIKLQFLDSNSIDSFCDPFNFQSDLEKNELLSMVQIAMNSLDEKYKEVLLLYWFGDFKFSEIALICNEKEATMRKRFERAMKQIDSILKPYFPVEK